jgi:hypothetical protein
LLQHEAGRGAEQARGDERVASKSSRRIAVIVPGMMGSTLTGWRGRVLWEEDMRANYRRILAKPSYIGRPAGGKPARGKVMKQFRFSVFKTDVWTRVYDEILAPCFPRPDDRIEFGYDWRDDIVRSARLLVETVARRLRMGQSGLRSERPDGAPTLVFFTHSLGSHVVRAALGSEELHSTWIDRLIHVAPALEGTPLMFRALYEKTTLPLLRELLWLRYLPNGRKYHRELLKAIRTFPSAFQSLPPPPLRYVRMSRTKGGRPVNPLTGTCIPYAMRAHAAQAHALLHKASSIIVRDDVLAYSVYTDPHLHLGKKTEIQYVATSRRNQRKACRYEIDKVLRRTPSGDGVVPASSASPAETGSTKVKNADHIVMCDHPKVVTAVKAYL